MGLPPGRSRQRRNRVKSNEVVISRPDVVAVVAYRRADAIEDTQIVLVREYRSPATTPDGFVYELPGGSSTTSTAPVDIAVAELLEETGLDIPQEQLCSHGSRQLAATMTAHRQHLFSVELTQDQLRRVREVDGPLGNTGDTERTYPLVCRYGDVLAERHSDWTTVGAITQALLQQDSAAALGTAEKYAEW